MERKNAMFGAAVLATVGAGAASWSLLTNTPVGSSAREFGRVGMAEAPPRPRELAESAGEGGQVAGAPEGAMRIGGQDMPEGLRAMLAGDAMDPATFAFPENDSENDARAMLDDVRRAIAAKASGAAAYRQAPPIGKQRFSEQAAAFIEPFFIESTRQENPGGPTNRSSPIGGELRGLEGAYFGEAMRNASLDAAHASVSDAPEMPVFTLPEGLELPAEREGDAERVERSVRMNFLSGAGGWSRHQANHPLDDGAERPEGVPVAQITLPLRARNLGDDIEDARFDATLWWDEDAQRWRPGDVTVRYKTKPDPSDERGSRMEMIRD